MPLATIAVKDLATAKKFYQQKLGFSPTGTEEGGVVTLQSGNSTIVVYESQFAGTNKATSATWGGGQRNGLHRAKP
jgi:catechol-2,3-dioxygenase